MRRVMSGLGTQVPAGRQLRRFFERLSGLAEDHPKQLVAVHRVRSRRKDLVVGRLSARTER